MKHREGQWGCRATHVEHTKIIQADSGRQGANDSQNNAYFSSLPTTNSDLNFATSISNLYSNQFNLLLKNRRCRSNQPTSLAYIKRKQYFPFSAIETILSNYYYPLFWFLDIEREQPFPRKETILFLLSKFIR